MSKVNSQYRWRLLIGIAFALPGVRPAIQGRAFDALSCLIFAVASYAVALWFTEPVATFVIEYGANLASVPMLLLGCTMPFGLALAAHHASFHYDQNEALKAATRIATRTYSPWLFGLALVVVNASTYFGLLVARYAGPTVAITCVVALGVACAVKTHGMLGIFIGALACLAGWSGTHLLTDARHGLVGYQVARDVIVDDAPRHENASVLFFSDARVLSVAERRLHPDDSDPDGGDWFFVAPVVSKGWMKGEKISVWAVCVDSTFGPGLPELEECVENWEAPHRAGMVERSMLRESFREAARNAEQAGWSSADGAIFIHWLEDPELLLRQRLWHGLQAVLLANVCLVLAVLLAWRNKRRLAARRPEEGGEPQEDPASR